LVRDNTGEGDESLVGENAREGGSFLVGGCTLVGEPLSVWDIRVGEMILEGDSVDDDKAAGDITLL
jgi:hypothetical protein